MERLSTIVIQKLLDGFFLGLDAVDGARRRIDKILGRPEEEPFEVVWPEPEQAAAPVPGNGDSAAAPPIAEPPPVEPEPVAAAPAKKAAAKKTAKKPAKKATAKKAAKKPAKKATKKAAGRPKVPMEIEDLSQQVKNGTAKGRALSPDDELAGKRMVARIVYVLGVAEGADLGALSSTEIAHVLSFGNDIETFGTNISRAIRQGTADLVEALPAKAKEINRYALTAEGRAAFAKHFG